MSSTTTLAAPTCCPVLQLRSLRTMRKQRRVLHVDKLDSARVGQVNQLHLETPQTPTLNRKHIELLDLEALNKRPAWGTGPGPEGAAGPEDEGVGGVRCRGCFAGVLQGFGADWIGCRDEAPSPHTHLRASTQSRGGLRVSRGFGVAERIRKGSQG